MVRKGWREEGIELMGGRGGLGGLRLEKSLGVKRKGQGLFSCFRGNTALRVPWGFTGRDEMGGLCLVSMDDSWFLW